MTNIYSSIELALQEILSGIEEIPVNTLYQNTPAKITKLIEACKTAISNALRNSKEKKSDLTDPLPILRIHAENMCNEIKKLESGLISESITTRIINACEKLRSIDPDKITINELRTQLELYRESHNKENSLFTNQNPTNDKKFYTNENTKIIKEINTRLESLEEDIDERRKNFEEAASKLESTYEKCINFIGSSNNKIHELLTLASNSVVNGSYKENSLRELRAADRLRSIAIILMLCIIAFTAFSLFQLHHSNIELTHFLLRVFAGFLFSIPAIYLTRESTKHRQNHLKYLRKSLDIAAFEPFIAPISESQKSILREEVTRKIFFTSDEENLPESYPIDANSILKELVSRIELKSKNNQ